MTLIFVFFVTKSPTNLDPSPYFFTDSREYWAKSPTKYFLQIQEKLLFLVPLSPSIQYVEKSFLSYFLRKQVDHYREMKHKI